MKFRRHFADFFQDFPHWEQQIHFLSHHTILPSSHVSYNSKLSICISQREKERRQPLQALSPVSLYINSSFPTVMLKEEISMSSAKSGEAIPHHPEPPTPYSLIKMISSLLATTPQSQTP